MNTLMNTAVLDTLPTVAVTDAVVTDAVVTDAVVELSEAQIAYNDMLEARSACATGLRGSDGLIITYAIAITSVAGEGWVYLVGREANLVKEERKMFDRAMGMIEGQPNLKLKAKCNTYWKRIREAAGYTKSKGVNDVKTIDQKTLAELKTMLNRIFNEESESDTCPLASEAKSNLLEAFEIMGGNCDELGEKA